MGGKFVAERIKEIQRFFSRTTSVFLEKDSKFSPAKGMFTVAQHVARVAQDIDWFIDGAFRKEGLDPDLASLKEEILKVTSLKKARAWMKRACARAVRVLAKKSDAEMHEPIAGPILTGYPRVAILLAMTDHTAHHRGALTVYARMLGRVPPMPYV
jgi:uncharacterized damage-inducible protein DinB